MEKLGTVIHGIGATEHLDSSGERIEVKGIDISSLTVDGLVNFEHKSEAPSQLIGKIIEAVKILTKADCKNKHHEYFWEKAGKTPYLYIKAVLFDKFNHAGAIDAVAMLQFDKASSESKSEESRQVAGFSIEGSRLDKEGALIKKCIARKMSFTAYPCNKACIAEILEPAKDDKNKMISLADLKAAFKKAEESEMDLMKEESDKYNKALGFKLKSKAPKLKPNIGPTAGEQKPAKPIEPKRILPLTTTPLSQKLKVGDRLHSPKPKVRTGRQIYNDPETWKAETDSMSNSRKAILNKVKKGNTTDRLKDQMMLSEDMEKARVDEGKSIEDKQSDRMARNNVSFKRRKSGDSDRKSTTKDSTKGVHKPISNVGELKNINPKGDKSWAGETHREGFKAASKAHHKRVINEQKQMPKPNLPKSEDMDKSNSTANIKTQMMQSEKTMKRKEILKSISQEAFDLFPHKEELLSSIRKTMPEANENEVMAFAKTFAYVALKKQEINMADLVKDSSLNEED